MNQLDKNGFFVFEGLIIFAVLLLLPFIAIRSFMDAEKKSKASIALHTIEFFAAECALYKKNGQLSPTFNLYLQLVSYKITPLDRSCSGDENNLISGISQNVRQYPTFSYDVETGEKTCSHDGPNEELHGCSAKSGGEWFFSEQHGDLDGFLK